MGKIGFFIDLKTSKDKSIRTFTTPEGLFKAVKTPEKDWFLYQVFQTHDKYLARVKCSEGAHNRTIYRHYIVD
jgi:hypothetical protein